MSLCALGTARAAPPAPDRAALLAQARTALEGLQVVHGRFVQTDAAGKAEAGTYWVQRPGRARFDYDPPSGVSIAADGAGVTVVDRRLNTQRRFPQSLTPLSLFLSSRFADDPRVRILNVESTLDGFAVTAASASPKEKGEITLRFSQDPVRLTGWTLTDARGLKVTVRLVTLERAARKPIGFFEIGSVQAQAPLPLH